jgi:predicted NBD/HSP70 family sugar kinase
MIEYLLLKKPAVTPPLDPEFRPSFLANHAFLQESKKEGLPVVIGLERDGGNFSRFETFIFPDNHKRAIENKFYIERLVKLLLWQRGGYRVYIGGSWSVGDHIRKAYSPDGPQSFDYHFMSSLVYESPFSVKICDIDEIPPTREAGKPIGRHLDGNRIGFDLGASDRKVSAVVNGNVVFSEEKVWNPSSVSDPSYHYSEILDSIKTASNYLPSIDAIGGSSAGIYIDNKPMVASLFRSIPDDHKNEIREIFHRLKRELKVPLTVINDGDVAALAGSMALGVNGILGIALGSSEAAGFVDPQGNILGWLNELAFAPIDFNPNAPIEEWSRDYGCGSSYLSQQCVFRLAPKVNITVPGNISNAEKLFLIQEKLQSGHEGAVKIWETMGVYLGYAIANYSDFYDFGHLIIMGRCTSGLGGTILLDQAKKVLKQEFPELLEKAQIQLPDEKIRRVGQAIAAASLPQIPA